MKHEFKKIVAALIVVFFFLSASFPMASSIEKINVKSSPIKQLGEEKELNLLRGEHFLFVNTLEDVDSFHIRYVFPAEYGFQVPIMLEILDDSTADICHYQIENDTNKPNKIVNFTIGSMKKDEIVLLHFYYWVLVKNHKYEDLPDYVKIPKECELPEETKTWLTSTEVVQANSFLIRLRAMQLRGLNDNLLTLMCEFLDNFSPDTIRAI